MQDARDTLGIQKSRLIDNLRAHSFLARCREGRVSLDELKFFLLQQGLYSSHFTRYLCALMANLPGNTDVLELAENLFEELGFAGSEQVPHYLLYRKLLSHFELNLDTAVPTAGTRGLIESMFTRCRDSRSWVGLAALCLGAEALVPAMYADIIAGFEAHGVSDDTLRFFHLHVQCDDGHAETIEGILIHMLEEEPRRLESVIAAGDALLEARRAFFSDIEQAFSRHAARSLLSMSTDPSSA